MAIQLRRIGGGKPAPASHEANLGGKPDSKGRSPSPRQMGEAVDSGLLKGAKPKPAEDFSASVRAELQAGETLVLGGYRLPDGSHEFTFMTPTVITLEDGTQAIKLQTLAMAMEPEDMHQTGLDTLSTQDHHSDQRAEAWSNQELTNFMKSRMEKVSLMTSPSIIALPGQPTTISIGGGPRQAHYSAETSFKLTTDGGVSIESRVTRTPAQQP